MGMTMTQKILANAAGKESVKAGELIMANLNLVLGNDITTVSYTHLTLPTNREVKVL